MLNENPRAHAAGDRDVVPVLRPQPRRDHVVVRRESGAFVVVASGVERIAARIQDQGWEAKMQFYRYLRRLGVVKALESAGAVEGDTVRLGEWEWEWE